LSAGDPSERRITDLDALLGGLLWEERVLAGRLFEVVSSIGRLKVPEGMRSWVEENFGSVDAVREQKIVRVTNRVTLEGALFNGLRALRPFDASGSGPDLLRSEIEDSRGDPFCVPEEGTPSDVFGRIRGTHSITASNVAKYDGFHGLVIFDDHDPLAFTPEKVDDYISVALEWVSKALEEDPEGWELRGPRPRPGHRHPGGALPDGRAPPTGGRKVQKRIRLGLLLGPVQGA
jgi:hypothetical protein